MGRDTEPRWSEPGLLVLAALRDGPLHGYGIAKEVQASSGVRLGAGTLYGAIARLEQRGLIEAMPQEERKRPYRLSGAGRRVLDEQLVAMEHFLGAARARQARPATKTLGPSGSFA